MSCVRARVRALNTRQHIDRYIDREPCMYMYMYLIEGPGHDRLVASAAVEVPLPDGEAPDVPRVRHQGRAQGKLRDVGVGIGDGAGITPNIAGDGHRGRLLLLLLLLCGRRRGGIIC